MNIAYSCDNAYVEQTGISLISVFENNKDEKEIVVYLISKGITKERLSSIIQGPPYIESVTTVPSSYFLSRYTTQLVLAIKLWCGSR